MNHVRSSSEDLSSSSGGSDSDSQTSSSSDSDSDSDSDDEQVIYPSDHFGLYGCLEYHLPLDAPPSSESKEALPGV